MNVRVFVSGLASVFAAFAALGQPSDPSVVAVVLGEEITYEQAEESDIAALIAGPLFEKFIRESDIRPMEEDISALTVEDIMVRVSRLAELGAETGDLKRELGQTADPERRKEITERLEAVATLVHAYGQEAASASADELRSAATRQVERWQLQVALYEDYGGRVIWRQASYEALDGQRRYLEEQQASGAFEIFDWEVEEQFWRHWRTVEHHVVPDADARESLSTPWWRMKVSEDDSLAEAR